MTDTELLSIVYSSSAADRFDDDALAALLAQSRAANSRDGLTGMLLYRDGRFIQVLEGPASTVRSLVDRIAADDRHDDMRVLLEQSVPQRSFADWTMGYEPIEVAPATEGFRDSFAELEDDEDAEGRRRALAELTLWFRVRSRA